jgi:tellurite resistance protein
MILMSPFGVAFLAYHTITGESDLFATGLYDFGIFLFCILSYKLYNRKKTFSYTWWAIGFPLAALTNAGLIYAGDHREVLTFTVAAFLLTCLTCAINFLLFKTCVLLIKGK